MRHRQIHHVVHEGRVAVAAEAVDDLRTDARADHAADELRHVRWHRLGQRTRHRAAAELPGRVAQAPDQPVAEVPAAQLAGDAALHHRAHRAHGSEGLLRVLHELLLQRLVTSE